MQHSPKTQWPHETRCQAKRVRLNLRESKGDWRATGAQLEMLSRGVCDLFSRPDTQNRPQEERAAENEHDCQREDAYTVERNKANAPALSPNGESANENSPQCEYDERRSHVPTIPRIVPSQSTPPNQPPMTPPRSPQ
jgi:hypothetical protein